MNKLIVSVFLIIAASLLFSACKKEGLEEYFPIPILKGDPNVGELEVKLDAKIRNSADHHIVGWGFEWQLGNVRYCFIETVSDYDKDSFSKTIDYALEKGETYNVTAFIVTPNQRIHSLSKEFVAKGSKPPVITSISALSGQMGDTITIEGSRFPESFSLGYYPPYCKLYFGSMLARIVKLEYDQIQAIVPYQYSASTFKLKLETHGNHTLDNIGDFVYLE